MFERVMTVHALDCAAIVIDHFQMSDIKIGKNFFLPKLKGRSLRTTFLFQWLFQPIQDLGLLFSSVIIFHSR
jgi:hypothetical protein